MENGHVLILHDIRSALNVGAIFRTADAVGISKIYLTGYTPAPLDRFGRERKDITKAALGAEKTIPWESHADIETLLDSLKEKGIPIVAIEQSPRAVDYKTVVIEKSSAFIVGNEVEGISESLLEKADIIAEIPMHGKKESLNVSVSVGVALYRFLDQ